MAQRCPRVVLDTNCLISALLFSHGTLAELRSHWQARRFVPVLCSSTARELLRVLTYPKFHLSPDELLNILGELLPWADVVTLTLSPATVAYLKHLKDPKDVNFILLAEQEKIALISGDRHLLNLEAYAAIPILAPAEFLAQLQDSRIVL